MGEFCRTRFQGFRCQIDGMMKIIESWIRYQKCYKKQGSFWSAHRICIFTATYCFSLFFTWRETYFFMILRGGNMQNCMLNCGRPNYFHSKAFEIVSRHMTKAAKWMGIEKTSGWLSLSSILAGAVSAACNIWQTSLKFEGLQLRVVQRRNLSSVL